MSERIFISFPTPSFPPLVRVPLVEIVATVVPFALTASKSKNPPEVNLTRSR